jgi:hypothetical protein
MLPHDSSLLLYLLYKYQVPVGRGAGTNQRILGVNGSRAGPKIDILKPSQLHPHPFENRDAWDMKSSSSIHPPAEKILHPY